MKLKYLNKKGLRKFEIFRISEINLLNPSNASVALI